jgi:protein CpxP
MRINKLSLIVAVAVGGLLLCNTMASAQDAPKKGRGPNPEQMLARMTETLSLTDEQKPKVKALLEDTAKKRSELTPEERREKGQALMEDQNKKLKEILTPEQYTKWEKMRQEMRKGGPNGKKGDGEKKDEK